MKLTFILLVCLVVSIKVTRAEVDNDFEDFDTDLYEEVPPNQADNEEKQNFIKTDLDEDDGQDDGVVEDEFDFTDKDEFENFGGADSQDNQETVKKAGEPKLTINETKIPIHFHNWDSYWVELLFIAGLVVYFVNYAMGKNKNIKIANSWLNAHKQLLEDNFALVGDDSKKETDSSQPTGLMKESDSIFTLWCSGRVCVEGMLIELKLIKRQDLLALAMGILNSKTQDQVVVKAELSKDSMDSFVFAVCNKRNASKMHKELTDLKQFCVSVAKADEKYGIPSGFTVLSELAEASSAILDAKVVAMLQKYSDVIESIHISDQFTGNVVPPEQAEASMKPPETKKMVTVSFSISEKTAMEDQKICLQLVIYLIDKLKRFKLSREGKSKADKNRSRVEEEFLKSLHSLRMEAAAQKVSEKRKQEKEKLMKEENVEKQMKLEKKMKRKDAKKAMPKTKSMSINL